MNEWSCDNSYNYFSKIPDNEKVKTIETIQSMFLLKFNKKDKQTKVILKRKIKLNILCSKLKVTNSKIMYIGKTVINSSKKTKNLYNTYLYRHSDQKFEIFYYISK